MLSKGKVLLPFAYLLMEWTSEAVPRDTKQNLEDPGFSLQVFADEITILVNGIPWLEQKMPLSRVVIHRDDLEFSNVAGTLQLAAAIPFGGEDNLGIFEGYEFLWTPANLNFATSVRLYQDNQTIIFKQSFYSELFGTSIANSSNNGYDEVTTSFPSLRIISDETRGFISYGGFMAAWATLSVGRLLDNPATIREGQFGGPLAIFDSEGDNTILISPLNYFMVSNMKYRSSNGAHLIDCGLMGSIESIPRGFELETILVLDSGIHAAHRAWGDALNRYHGKTVGGASDVATDYLGYWTDNGAFYYYNPAEGMNYEETLLQMDQYFKANNLPVRYMNIDSWWYFKGNDLGVKNWTAMPDIFPNGIQPIHEATGWPFLAHNRYWATDTDYAVQNGGEFDFYIEMVNRKALPGDIELWRHLFRTSLPWGLEVYEQDWQDRQFVQMNITHTDVNAARMWLVDLGTAASEFGITLQYCMSLPRQILQSVEAPAKVRTRTSADYLISRDNWRIGLSNMFSVSLGVVPFKNVFWSAEENLGNSLYYECMVGNENTDPNLPWSLNYRYTGPTNHSQSGRQCLYWSDLELHVKLPLGDLERNECRNPGTAQFGNGIPFCFVEASLSTPEEEWVWENCSIPICGQDCEVVGSGEPTTELPSCQPFREANPALHAVVSSLSRGGVGPGDKLENLNVDLIMRTCRDDGLLLHPGESVLATEAQILRMAFDNNHNPSWPHSYYFGDIWRTQTTLTSSDSDEVWIVDYIFVAETRGYGAVSAKQLGLLHETSVGQELVWHKLDSDEIAVIQMTDETLIEISDLGMDQFELWYFAPLWHFPGPEEVSVALLGEKAKYIPVSNQRIISWSQSNQDFLLNMQGAPNELVTISFYTRVAVTAQTIDCTCQIGVLGFATIVLDTVASSCSCLE